MIGFGIVLNNYNTFLAGYCKERHLQDSNISTLLAAIGGTIVVSKVISGFVFDIPWIKPRRVHLFACVAVINGLLVILSPSAGEIVGKYFVHFSKMIRISQVRSNMFLLESGHHWRIEGGGQGGLGPPPLKLVKV